MISEVELAKSWMHGAIANREFSLIVGMARAEFAPAPAEPGTQPSIDPEPLVRTIWNWLEAVLDGWKYKEGDRPIPPAPLDQLNLGALSTALATLTYWPWGETDPDEIPAYAWAGLDSYSALVAKLLSEKHPLIVKPLSTIKLSERKLWATVILKEASQSNLPAAILAYSHWHGSVHTEQLQLTDAMLPLVLKGAQQKANLKKGASRGAAANKARADESHDLIMKRYLEIRRNNPTTSQEDAAKTIEYEIKKGDIKMSDGTPVRKVNGSPYSRRAIISKFK
jgi:hypothetical protein